MRSFSTTWIVPLFLPFVLALFRRALPRNTSAELAVADDDRSLPYGVAGAIMWALGLVIAVGGFYLLRFANVLIASMDRVDSNAVALFTAYPTPWIWMFFPGFACLILPWLTVLALLRRFGYAGQAARIVVKGNQQMGLNGERLMGWLAYCLVCPIGIFTVLALPMHLKVFPDELHLTHYRHWALVVFRFADARRAYIVDGYTLRDGSFQPHWDLLIDFADGRRLSGNAVGDGGTVPSEELVSILLGRSGLQPEHVRTVDDIR